MRRDDEARGQAATRFDRNLVVTAGAGTGKTSLLVERAVNLLLSGRVALQNLVAITFTEKAAGELRERVASALEAVARATAPGTTFTPGEDTEAGRALAWLSSPPAHEAAALHARAEALLANLNAAPISTIHSFCSDLLRRHAPAAGLPLEFSVDKNGTEDLLFDEMWPEFLAEELGTSPPRALVWSRLFDVLLDGEIEEAARALIRRPVAADLLARDGYHALDPQATFGPALGELRDAFAAILGSEKVGAKFRLFLEVEIRLAEAFLGGGPRALRAASLDPLPKFWDRYPDYEPGKNVPRGAEYKVMAKRAYGLLKSLRDVNEDVCADLFHVLRAFALKFRARVHRDGMLTFDDLLLLSRNVLRDRPEVRAAEAARARAIFVDEFQDTDPIQYEIVFLLAARPEAVVLDPYRAPLEPGRLFIVGDPKQSIYRFRGADIAAYQRAVDHVLEDGDERSLVTNFRSGPEILEPVNRLFETWMQPASAEDRLVEPVYESIVSSRDRVPGGGPGIELWSVTTAAGRRTEHRRPAEARAIARGILEWTRGEGCRYGDLALLFRALTDVSLYTRELRQAGIPFVVDGGKAFAERAEVTEALALLGALANPADPVATLAVLRSTLGGVQDGDLLAFTEAGGRFAWNQERGMEKALDRVPRVREVFGLLRELDRRRRALPLDRWVHEVLTEGDVPLLTAAYHEGAQRVANLRKLAARAGSLIRARGLTLERTVAALGVEFTGVRAEGESPLADESLDAVRILSIHRAKGLEFPVVIVPDLSRKDPQDNRDTRVEVLRADGRLHVEIVIAGRSRLRNTAAVIGQDERRRHEAAESKRLLYVATTRTRRHLVLVNSAAKPQGSWIKRIQEAWGYDPQSGMAADSPERGLLAEGQVVHVRRDGDLPPGGEPRAEETDPTAAVLAFEAARHAAARERAARFRTPSRDHRAEGVDAGDEEGEKESAAAIRSRESALAVGVALHRLLEAWDFRDGQTLRRHLPLVIEETARGSGLAPATIQAEAERVLAGFLASDLPLHLAAVEILGREVPILYRDAQGNTVHGYADLIYRHAGRVHVADYKTDADPGRERALSYREQLADYAEAVRRAWALPEPPVGEVLFLRTGERMAVLGGDAGT